MTASQHLQPHISRTRYTRASLCAVTPAQSYSHRRRVDGALYAHCCPTIAVFECSSLILRQRYFVRVLLAATKYTRALLKGLVPASRSLTTVGTHLSSIAVAAPPSRDAWQSLRTPICCTCTLVRFPLFEDALLLLHHLALAAPAHSTRRK